MHAYMEEFDLGLRLLAAGWRAVGRSERGGSPSGVGDAWSPLHQSALLRRLQSRLSASSLWRPARPPRASCTAHGGDRDRRRPADLARPGRRPGARFRLARRAPGCRGCRRPRRTRSTAGSDFAARCGCDLASTAARGVSRRPYSIAAIEAEAPLCPICTAALGDPVIHAPDRLHETGGHHEVARCPACGAGTTFPRVSDEQLADFYPEQYGPYGEGMGSLQRLISRAIRWLQGRIALRTDPLSALRDRRPGRGLDVGCGRGDLAALLIGRGWTMTGVEPSPAACAAAARRGVDARCGTLTTVRARARRVRRRRVPALAGAHQRSGRRAADGRGGARPRRPRADHRSELRLAGKPAGFGGFWFHLDLPRHRVHFDPRCAQAGARSAGLEVVSVSTSSSTAGCPARSSTGCSAVACSRAGSGYASPRGSRAHAAALGGARPLAGGGDLLHAVARRR